MSYFKKKKKNKSRFLIENKLGRNIKNMIGYKKS